MTEQAQLPDLPLMLAGLPRAVGNLLLEAGIPSEELPQVPLLAAGTGRFVLFDPQNARSAARARRAAAGGLRLLDVREIAGVETAPFLLSRDYRRESTGELPGANTFLERLKATVESRGGVWVRLGDYPFPFQSAICVGIEHVSEELAEFADIAAALPGKATHFVSSRLRPERLAYLSQAAPVELGWQIIPADYEASPRRTLSYWSTRIERFSAANLHPQGVALGDDWHRAPAAARLWPLGLRFSCRRAPGAPCRAERQSPDRGAPPWIRFHTRALPERERFLEWVGEHYQSGCPLFLEASTGRLDFVHELLRLAGDARRCSLLWQTSFGEFSRWWAVRRSVKL